MSIIQAGNTTTTALIYTADTTGNLVFTTGGANTVALTIDSTQNITTTQKFASASMPTGSILQVVQTNYTGTASSTSATPANVSGFSATITPKFSTSKVLVTVCTNFGFDSSGGTDPYPYILLLRNGTSVGAGVNATGSQINVFISAPSLPGEVDARTKYKYLPVTRMFLDSPANTSALIYQIQLAQPYSAGAAYLNRQASTDNNTYIQSTASSITLMEVAA